MVTKTQETGQVSEKAKDLWIQCKALESKKIETFLEGFETALKDVDKGWKKRKGEALREIFEKVQAEAQKILVGGHHGISKGTFYGYCTTAKKVLIYGTSWQNAKNYSGAVLNEARKEVTNGLYKDAAMTDDQRMAEICQTITKRIDEEKAKAHQISENDAIGKYGRAPIPNGIVWSLPDPDNVEEGVDILAQGLDKMLDWLQQKKLERVLNGDAPSAVTARRVLGECAAFFNARREVA